LTTKSNIYISDEQVKKIVDGYRYRNSSNWKTIMVYLFKPSLYCFALAIVIFSYCIVRNLFPKPSAYSTSGTIIRAQHSADSVNTSLQLFNEYKSLRDRHDCIEQLINGEIRGVRLSLPCGSTSGMRGYGLRLVRLRAEKQLVDSSLNILDKALMKRRNE
jgi:hypothetical protein